jgi:hypothetical protein
MAVDADGEAERPPVRAGRRRGRWFAGTALAAVLAASIGGLVAVRRGPDPAAPRDRVAEALATASTWLHAWSAGDRSTMRALVVHPSPQLAATLDEIAGLHPASIRAAAGFPLVQGATASVPFDVEVVLTSLGVWRYHGTIPLADTEVRVDGARERQWRVPFSPSVVHPDLRPGDDLALKLAWPRRAELQSDDGTPLPAGHALGSVLGLVGPATAAQAKTLGPPYRAGDRVGQSGLESTYERLLAGTPAGELQLVRNGAVAKVEASFVSTPGRPIRTTIDLSVQAAAEAALGNEGNSGAMVVIKPSTGGIVAVANRPQNGFSRALLGRYPPGSTFKVITTLALLQKGVTPDTRISCPKEVTVNGRVIANAESEELGDISFRDAFAHSCNSAFIQLAERLSNQDLLDAAKAFGFNTDTRTGAGLPRSEVPEPRGMVDLVSAAIGQSRIQVTPMQMASVAATVANGGYRVPHFVDQLDNAGSMPLPAGTAATLQGLMRLVVTEGTGKKAAVGGTPVSGKTGTAEFGTANPPHTHAWFISFRGDLASAVLVEDAGFGGDVAAPIAAAFYRQMG